MLASSRIPASVDSETVRQSAVCPDCKQTVQLQKSGCTCDACRNTLFFVKHDRKPNVACVGSRLGYKQPTVEPTASVEAAISGEAKP